MLQNGNIVTSLHKVVQLLANTQWIPENALEGTVRTGLPKSFGQNNSKQTL